MRTNILILLIPILLFVGFIWLAVGGLMENQEGKTLVSSVGKPAPELKLPILGSNAFLTRDDLKGKKMLVNFFASWCVPCAEENDFLLELRKTTRLPIIGLVYKDKEAAVKKFFDTRASPYTTVALDNDGRAAIDWGVTGVPETFLIGADGAILAHIAGPLTDALWDKYFKALVDDAKQ